MLKICTLHFSTKMILIFLQFSDCFNINGFKDCVAQRENKSIPSESFYFLGHCIQSTDEDYLENITTIKDEWKSDFKVIKKDKSILEKYYGCDCWETKEEDKEEDFEETCLCLDSDGKYTSDCFYYEWNTTNCATEASFPKDGDGNYALFDIPR